MSSLFFLSLEFLLDLGEFMFNILNIFFPFDLEVVEELVLMLQQESEGHLELLSHVSQLLLGHLHLIVERVNTEEADSLLDELGNFHELVLGSLFVQLLSHNEVIEDVALMLDVELLVLVAVELLEMENFLFLVV